MSTRPEDLTGEARERFDTWRRLGLSEAAAMDQLRRDGLLEAIEGREQFLADIQAATGRPGLYKSDLLRALLERAMTDPTWKAALVRDLSV